MVFSTLPFLFFYLVAVLLIYRLAPLKLRNLILLLASLFFYGWGEPVYILIMLASIAIDYTHGILVERWRADDKKARMVVASSVICNLAILVFFKYWDFLAVNLNTIIGTGIPAFTSSLGSAVSGFANFTGLNLSGVLRCFDFLAGKLNAFAASGIPTFGLPLPIGVSFYTFQTMSYTIDVYRRDAPAQRNVITFGAYVTLFPQLIAGPIIRYKSVADQLEKRDETLEKFAAGVRRFTVGLAKKVLLANAIGRLWDAARGAEELTVAMAWLGIAAYAFQIYFDFSGYSDMAIGLGKLFGFDFLENFNYPYISKSIVEFWKRWHISLTTWFREYVYFPLGGNRVPKWKWIRNILIVWLLTGIWHGAGWNFLFWGLYYAAWMLLERLFLGKQLEKLPDVLRHIYTMAVVLVGWAIFELTDLGQLGRYLLTLFGGGRLWSAETGYYLRSYLPMLAILCVAATPLAKKGWAKLGEKAQGVLEPLLILGALVLCTASLVDASYNPFLYFRF